MDGWIDEYVNGWMDGWIDGLREQPTGGSMGG